MMGKTLLGIPIDKIDVNKYIRQLRGVVRWKWSGGRGTLEYATGVGKTFTAIIAIKKMLLTRNIKVIIVVPTTQLKNQWDDLCVQFGITANIYVINTIALKKIKYDCDLLVLDEVHLFASNQFSTVFNKVSYKHIMSLTATLKRLDGKEKLIERHAPVCDVITQQEAIKNGWISDFVEINLPVYLTREEISYQKKLNKEIQKYMATFGSFDRMKDCMNSVNAEKFALRKNLKTQVVIGLARKGMAKIRERKNFLDNTEHKVQTTLELIDALNMKTIVFSQNVSFAERVASKTPSVLYHSNIKSQVIEETVTKAYVNPKAATRFAKKVNGTIEIDNDLYIVEWSKKVKYGAKRMRELALDMFTNNKVPTICSAIALDQGTDVKDIDLGIDASRTSNPTQHTQRTGRICRNFVYSNGKVKKGYYVNLYVPDYVVSGSADEVRLRKAQVNSKGIYYVNDIDECISLIKSIHDQLETV